MSEINSGTFRNQLPAGRPNGWVTLDRSWAKALDVQRDRGIYRIRHRELVRWLAAIDCDVPLTGTWIIDPVHTNVGFVAPHLVIARVRGGFRGVSGTVSLGTRPADSWVDVIVEMASIDTGQPRRDAHLRSADFLDTVNHPQMRFRSTGLEIQGPHNGRLTGDLTLRGVTRSVTLELRYLGAATDQQGTPKLAFEARGLIDREEFGLVWNRALETGGLLVGRHIELQIDAQAVATAA